MEGKAAHPEPGEECEDVQALGLAEAPALSTRAGTAVRMVNAAKDSRMTGRRPTQSDNGPHTSVITPYGTR